jgi:hypothetical protein
VPDSYEERQLLDKWQARAELRERVHYLAAGRFELRRLILGGFAGGLSAVVGTSVFTTLTKNQSTLITLGTGLISIAVAVLAAMQTILRFPEQATNHHSASADFGKIRRFIEQVQAYSDVGTPVREEVMTQIREQYDTAAQKAPVPPKRLWHKAEKELRKEKEAPERPR